MGKVTKTILLTLAALFFLLGLMSAYHSKPYAELTDIETIDGTIFKLHCANNGAAALSLNDSAYTFNLTIKFDQKYCDDNTAEAILGKKVSLEALKVSNQHYQVYRLTSNGQEIISPDDVAADQSSSTYGLFFLAFLTLAFVLYKSRKKPSI